MKINGYRVGCLLIDEGQELSSVYVDIIVVVVGDKYRIEIKSHSPMKFSDFEKYGIKLNMYYKKDNVFYSSIMDINELSKEINYLKSLGFNFERMKDNNLDFLASLV